MAARDPGYPTAAGSSLSVVVDPKVAEELAWLGYDLMGTANNHSTDYGVEASARRSRTSSASASATPGLP